MEIILSHEMPCPSCGHGPHQYLPCDAGCGCAGAPRPLQVAVASAGW